MGKRERFVSESECVGRKYDHVRFCCPFCGEWYTVKREVWTNRVFACKCGVLICRGWAKEIEE